ncbi:hypothetical protein SAMN02910298_00352 [Pseudobutyrivibrio sp. YE44]|uniref:hypothetical protein n=1 Tax=Pseudobutyrivibrio sp. YE44 TaxID=1520802 RepID=UPI000885565A|nr:hypothetical protein [Pseudobutyrivibrio sp. YE44]SDB08667.1 hypothetical protein SAMN02910298_00352 [Pseudobutyrivibrio sp. YE44]
MNIYDRNSFDIDSIDQNSKGLQLAKMLPLSRIIIGLYGLAFDFLVIYCIYYKNPDWFRSTFPVLFTLATILLCMCLIFTCNIVVGTKAKSLSLQEKHDYNLYLYYKMYNRRKGYRNFALLSLARIDSMTGDREQCANAVSLISPDFKNDDLTVIKEWLETEDAPLERENFKEQKQPKKSVLLIGSLIVFYGLAYAGLDVDMFYFSNIPGYFALLSGAISAFAFAYIYTLAISVILTRITRKKIAKPIIVVILAVLTIVMYLLIGTESYNYCRYRHTGNYYGDKSYDAEDDMYDDFAYTQTEDYEGEHNIDMSSEPLNDLDIMNMMIVLGGYLKDQGIIEDYYTSIAISFSAKGNVRGTVYKDDEYEYNLYDNGTKQDENGNECLELVLEAEPLDEEGNSLGQAEAILKGFYLVNIETNEIIDEHKTHW